MERFKLPGIIVTLLLVFGISGLQANQMPYRKELNSDVRFWKLVFSEISSNQYIIHDSDHLSIIYTIITFDSTVSHRARQRYLRSVKDKYEKLLLKLERSDTTNLENWEQKVFEKFKKIDDEDKYRRAVRRIRAQQGIREKFVKGVKQSSAYLPIMEEIFKRHGLPRELVYMPHIESSFNIHAISRAGARGMWQFMWGTARYFMRMDRIVDQRFDPIYSTEAAAKLLKKNYEGLQNWALAITAYNHGLAGMKRAKRRFGNDYLKIRENYLRRSFGFASKNFYPEFLAIVDIMDSLQYYLPEIKQSPPFTFSEVKLGNSINLTRLSKELNLSKSELKTLNPSFKNSAWYGITTKREYTLRLPAHVDMEKALAFLGRTPSVPKKEVQEPDEPPIKVFASLHDVSFQKPEVEPGNENPVIAFEPVLDEQRNENLIDGIPAFAYQKPGVEVNPQINASLFSKKDFLRNRNNEQQDNLLAMAFEKPEVDPAGTIVNNIQFDWNSQPIVEAKEEEIETSSPEPPADDGLIASRENTNAHIDKASNSISLDEIRDILVNRLAVKSNHIVIFPNETIGHIADWLQVSASYLRTLNGLKYGHKIYSGQRLRLDFSYVSPEQFCARRLNYHMGLVISELNGRSELKLVNHTVSPGETLWNISRSRSKIPVNLLHYFNDLNKLEQLYPGDIIKLPII